MWRSLPSRSSTTSNPSAVKPRAGAFCSGPWLSPPASSSAQFVIRVLDVQGCRAAQPDVGHRLIGSRQPELSDLLVAMFDVRFLDPERRVFGRLGVDAFHREIGGVHANLSAIEELVVAPRLHPQPVAAAIDRKSVV